MHIIVLENQPSSRQGGQEIILFDICSDLAKRGHSISLLYLTEGNLLKQYQEFCTHILKINSFVIDRSTITDSLKLLADIWKIPTTRNSVVYSKQYHDVFFGSMLAFSKNIPFVCQLMLPPLENGFSRPLAIGLKGVKNFIALSDRTKLDWVDSGLKEEKIDIVNVGINLEVYKPSDDFPATRKEWGIPEHTKVISYIGRLDKEKGLETLIKGFALLVKSGISTRLLIAGNPVAHSSPEAGEEYKKALEQLATDLGIEKDVSFLGHVTNTTYVYQVSDVTVLASKWSEPFGRAIIESMACGTPVVASRTGGIPEILTGEFQSGLFEPGNERALSDVLNQVMNWRDSDPHLGNRCREHVLSKFSLTKMIDGIEQVLLKALRTGGSFTK